MSYYVVARVICVLDKFRIFYSPVCVTKLKNEKKRSNKFDSTSVEGYYLGASGNDSGRLVRSSRHTKPVHRKDVHFLEDIKGSIDTGLPLDWHSSPTTQNSEQASCQQTSTDVHFEQPEAEGDSDSESDEWPSSTPEEAVETRSVRTRKPRVPHNIGGTQAVMWQDAKTKHQRQVLCSTVKHNTLTCRQVDQANALASEVCVPKNYKDALSCPQSHEWVDSMKREYKNFTDMGVWEEVPNTESRGQKAPQFYGRMCSNKVG